MFISESQNFDGEREGEGENLASTNSTDSKIHTHIYYRKKKVRKK